MFWLQLLQSQNIIICAHIIKILFWRTFVFVVFVIFTFRLGFHLLLNGRYFISSYSKNWIFFFLKSRLGWPLCINIDNMNAFASLPLLWSFYILFFYYFWFAYYELVFHPLLQIILSISLSLNLLFQNLVFDFAFQIVHFSDFLGFGNSAFVSQMQHFDFVLAEHGEKGAFEEDGALYQEFDV